MKPMPRLDLNTSEENSLLTSIASHHEPEITARKMAAIIEKLANINDILCCVHNMRAKDIRTRVCMHHVFLSLA
jgi:hypothetical protein